MSLDGGGGSTGCEEGRINIVHDFEVGLTEHGLRSKIELAEESQAWSPTNPFCVNKRLEALESGDRASGLQRYTAEVESLMTDDGNWFLRRRCGNFACKEECIVLVDNENTVQDFAYCSYPPRHCVLEQPSSQPVTD